MTRPTRTRTRLAVATAALLLVPAVAMRYTHEVVWGPGDFVVAAVLLYGAGLTAVVLARRLPGDRKSVV